jgi:hypothetical protein
MKDQKKDTEPQVEKMFGMTFTVDENLNKYKAPEFESPKLKKVREKFSKSGLNFKQPSHS